MTIKLHIVHAFTQWSSWWNKAWIIFADSLTKQQKQKIAQQEQLSEIVFVRKWKKVDYDVEFFTPNSEVDLCGHATIGLFGLMRETNMISIWTYTLKTKVGILQVVVDANNVFMEQSTPIYYDTNIQSDEIYQSLGIIESISDTLPIQMISTGAKDIIIPVSSLNQLANIQPDHNQISQISEKYWAIWYHVFCLTPHNQCIAQCRNFAPLYWIPEESATWTSNLALTYYLKKYLPNILSTEIIQYKQGVEMWQTSIISVKLWDSTHQTLMVWWTIGQIINKDIYIS